MRVAFMSPCWPHDRIANGIATYVANVRGGLAARGVDSHVLAAEVAPDLDDPSIHPLPAGSPPRPLPVRLRQSVAGLVSRNLRIQESLGFRIARAVQSIDARTPLDLFELEETFGVAAVVRRHLAIPVVVRLHGPWCEVGPQVGHPRDREFHLRCRAEIQAISRAHGVSSPSRSALQSVRDHYGVALPDARVIPNPVVVPEEAEAWSPATSEEETLLFVGRFDRVKGADLLLEGFAQLARRRPRLRLRFLGPDTGLMVGGREISFDEYVADRIPDEVRERIDYEGAQPRDVVARARQRGAVTVACSRYETFSLTVLEAMAAGCPVAASDVGGVPEFLRDGENGLLFPSESVEALVSAVERLLDDRELAARLGAAARRDTRARFGVEAVAAETEAFHREVITANR